jgi:DNA-binding transcriptional LysR family regulator
LLTINFAAENSFTLAACGAILPRREFLESGGPERGFKDLIKRPVQERHEEFEMRLELNLVEVFCCVYEERTYAKAARLLRCSPETVRAHIKNLEKCIGAKLFDRSGGKIVATKTGQILYKHGRSIMHQKAEATQEIRKLLDQHQGSLLVSCSQMMGDYVLPQIVAAFHSRFPDVTVEMRVGGSEEVCDDITTGAAEVGFVGAKFDRIGLESRVFGSDELALVVPNNKDWRHVKSIAMPDLVTKRFIGRERGSGTRMAFEKKIGRSIEELTLVACLGSTGAIKEAIKAGYGVSVISTIAIKCEIALGALKTVEIEGITPIRRDLFVVTNKNLTLSPIAGSFVEYVLSKASAASSMASA